MKAYVCDRCQRVARAGPDDGTMPLRWVLLRLSLSSDVPLCDYHYCPECGEKLLSPVRAAKENKDA